MILRKQCQFGGKQLTFQYYLDKLRRARKQDINVMFHLAIVDAVEWGSQFSIFSDLPISLKVSLLQSNITFEMDRNKIDNIIRIKSPHLHFSVNF